jgi:hypothetical protein
MNITGRIIAAFMTLIAVIQYWRDKPADATFHLVFAIYLVQVSTL